MNITLSVDDELVARAREVAQRQGSSLTDLIRRYLETIAGRTSGETCADEMRELWREQPGHSGGQKIDRAMAYEGRL
jgi:hypothetical protein